MGFLSKLVTSAVKVVLTPVAVVTDGVNIVKGESPVATGELLESAADDFNESWNDLGDGNVL